MTPVTNKMLYHHVVKMTLMLLFVVAGCHVTGGAICWLIVLVGCVLACNKRFGAALGCILLLPLFTELNPIISKCGGVVFSLAVRIGPLLIGSILAFSNVRLRDKVPLGMLYIYLLSALISSMNGYAPAISTLKILNFSVFMFILIFGSACMSRDFRETYVVRIVMLSIAVLLIFGSIVLIPFPGVSQLSALSLAREGMSTKEAAEMLRNNVGQSLFCGMTNQSQTLGPLLGLLIGWVLADMLFVVKRFEILHVTLILGAMPLLYLTRSRCALLVAVSSLLMVLYYARPKIKLPIFLKIKINLYVKLFVAVIVLLICLMEIRNQTISKWLRKTDDIAGDNRSMTEAVTQSRQGKIAENMYDFKQNPLFGMGFQVKYDTEYKYGKWAISAPIEKGVIHTMILGEGGVIGLFIFILFLFHFALICRRKRYHITFSLFIAYIMANMGEATFFSPGGSGGILWMISIVGGCAIDYNIKYDMQYSASLYS